jgi:hypothetical protein
MNTRILKFAGLAVITLAGSTLLARADDGHHDACAWSDEAAKKDGDAIGKELVAGNNSFIPLLDKHYGPKGDRKCAAPAFLDELALYEKQQIGRSDVTLFPAPVPPGKGQFSSPYVAADGTTKGYTVEFVNIYANDAVIALKTGSFPEAINKYILEHLNDKDVEPFKLEFDRRRGNLPYDANIVGTDVVIEDSAK